MKADKELVANSVARRKITVLTKHYKLICWLIWLIGLCSIGGTWFFCQKHLSNFLFATLFSSISFVGLAIYTKKVFENKKLDSYHQNIKFSGIAGAFILMILFAIQSFSSTISSFSPASFFGIVSFGTMIIGFIIGGLIYIAITKIRNKKL